MIGWKELKPGITALKVKLLCSLLDISVSGRAFFTSVESDESDFMQYLQVSYFWTENTCTLDPGNKTLAALDFIYHSKGIWQHF